MTSPLPIIVDSEDRGMKRPVEEISFAIEAASGQRAFGLYDYSGYCGDAPPHVVRDERTHGVVFRGWDADQARAIHERLQREFIGRCALNRLVQLGFLNDNYFVAKKAEEAGERL